MYFNTLPTKYESLTTMKYSLHDEVQKQNINAIAPPPQETNIYIAKLVNYLILMNCSVHMERVLTQSL